VSDDLAADEVAVALLGDVNPSQIERPFDCVGVASFLDSVDVRFANSECCYADPSVEIPYKKGWFHTAREEVTKLTEGRFDVVGCANNVHYGEDAILESIRQLDGQGIAHVGAGVNRDEARRPAIVDVHDTRVGFLSYSSLRWPIGHVASEGHAGIASMVAYTAYRPLDRVLEMPGQPPEIRTWADPQELRELVRDVEGLSARVDVVVVSMHWGVSSSSETLDYQCEVGRAAIAAGADVVIGHHPHVVQGVEVYRAKPIFYSLGNFAFAYPGWTAIAVDCRIRGRQLAGVSWRPIEAGAAGEPVMLDPATTGESIVSEVMDLSVRFGTEQRVDGERVHVSLTDEAASRGSVQPKAAA
jgi:Bacterial capsule synthesis protein PGA_cap